MTIAQMQRIHRKYREMADSQNPPLNKLWPPREQSPYYNIGRISVAFFLDDQKLDGIPKKIEDL